MEIIVNDSIVSNTFTCLENSDGSSFNIWMIIAIIELIIIVLLLVLRKKNNVRYEEMRKVKGEILKGEINFDNTFMSAFHSKELYNKLKVSCHPNRFAPDEEKMKIADDIFQRMRKYETNYCRKHALQGLQTQISPHHHYSV